MNKQTNIGNNNIQVINLTNIYETASEIGELLRNGKHDFAEQTLKKLEEANTKSLNSLLNRRFILLMFLAIVIVGVSVMVRISQTLIDFTAMISICISILMLCAYPAKVLREKIINCRLKQTAITDIRKEIIKYAMFQELKTDAKVKANDVK